MQAFVDKFRYGTRSRQSLSREKLIDKIELPDIEKSSRISPYFNFKQKRPSGKEVLKVAGLTKSFGEQMVLKNINFSINKGEKLLFIGPNGIGKSTLLKLITSNLVADSGNFEWGHNTQISYFAQDHHELLNKNITMFDWISEYASKETSSHIRSMLGQALFSKDEINKDIMSLSGGEAARLLFVKIILEQSNVLIFDEPTNHLDVEATDALIKSLGEYEGTLLFVTHDRYVASKLATRIIAITPKSIKDYAGTYDEYMEHYGDDYLSLTWLKANK
jgi:ATPase subunit of ABC transporter with duplicated ATPase domains